MVRISWSTLWINLYGVISMNTGIWNFSVNFLIFFYISILCDLTLLIGLCVSLLRNDVDLVEISTAVFQKEFLKIYISIKGSEQVVNTVMLK